MLNVFAVVAFAEETAVPQTIEETEAVIETTAAETQSTAINEETYINVLDATYKFFSDNRNIIILFLNTCLTGFSIFLSKSRMMPGLTGLNTNFTNIISGTETNIISAVSKVNSYFIDFINKLNPLLNALTAALNKLTDTEKRFDILEAEKEKDTIERQALYSMLQLQAETFNDIIQSSTLPQYKKDEYGMKYKTNFDIISKIKEGEGSDETL